MEQLPLVSLLLITYKQSKFVRAAIRSVLAQDYPNLEIIISDDSSPDDTWQLIQDEVARATAPHKTILTRTAQNSGLSENINAGIKHCSGDWIIMAAGDDISLPNRVTKIVSATQSAPNILAVASDFHSIDEDGAPVPLPRKSTKIIKKNDEVTTEEALAAILRCKPFPRLAYSGTLLGATAAWHRSLFDQFGPLPHDLISEDAVLTLRARLIGQVRVLPDRLIEYRKHLSSLTNAPRQKSLTRIARAREQEVKDTALWHREAILSRCMYNDLKRMPPSPIRDRFLPALEHQTQTFNTLKTWWTHTWPKRLIHYLKSSPKNRIKPKLLLPRALYLYTQALTLKKK